MPGDRRRGKESGSPSRGPAQETLHSGVGQGTLAAWPGLLAYCSEFFSNFGVFLP